MPSLRKYYTIKDNCREGLLRHLRKAISHIPDFVDANILDAGCGTGVPALFMAENIHGKITAVDPDANAIIWLANKIRSKKLEGKFDLYRCPIFDFQAKTGTFDIVLAEGLLNIIGFEAGIIHFLPLLKEEGIMVIHDEIKDHEKKLKFLEANNCELIASFKLDEKDWWEGYYRCMENKISEIKDKELMDLFESDKKEIEWYRKDPKAFQSIYYIIKKNK